MSNSNSLPGNLKYTASHEWVNKETDGTITIGITQHAQELLGDMVFVESPAVGRQLKAKEECAIAESVKAAADLYAPVTGVVVAINSELGDTPEKINTDPYSAWIFKMKPDNAADVDALLDASAYQTLVDSEAH
ncbi:glycine cleavage system protein GcvH [Candidatus Nitrotoga sp. M5]|uniref:glycine cleavage system protein GcvH n=1 Tax=Candidatus Nitrotoga sp. M5 TaxID=2890409 RepID=UPI001EF22FDC|nr:glycine cleavage system protein GcvH [Candidatus Nitrotoga sp. M5]CAH1385855.1 glycine cleavage system H protein [Candidatus Nitrotoga sp. M5]